jgi:hypothetical protein
MGVPLRDFAFGRDSLDGRLHYPRFGHYRFAQIAAVPNLIFSDSGWQAEALGFAHTCVSTPAAARAFELATAAARDVPARRLPIIFY